MVFGLRSIWKSISLLSFLVWLWMVLLWIIFRDECLSRLTEEDKGHLIEFDKYCDNILKNVASCNKKYVQKQLDKLDENYLDYIGYWNDKYYRAGFGDCLNLIIMSLDGGKFETR